MIVDVCTYNNEEDLWDIHYSALKGYVDEFIVLEFDTTFSGKPRKQMFPVKQYPDVKHYYVEESWYSKYYELADSSPNTLGASHWRREFAQKESIRDALQHLKDTDIVFIGDVDEIWEAPRVGQGYIPDNKVIKLKLKVYTYYLNNRSSEQFWGTVVGRYKNFKDKCLNDLRTNSQKWSTERGWHFTSMGGPSSLKEKLTDSYTAESYATDAVLAALDKNYGYTDFLGRPFTYQIDESNWPEYLKENRDKYLHLLAP